MNSLIKEISIDKFDLSLAEMPVINPKYVLCIQNSIYLHGQLQSVVARPVEGKYQLIDSIKRVYAAMELMIETLQYYVLDVDLKQAKLPRLSIIVPTN